MNQAQEQHPANRRRNSMARNALILLVAFLLGLLPPLFRTIQLKRDLARTQSELELSQTREIASLAYLEVSQNNFGVASRHASDLYSRLDHLARTGEEPVKSIATEALQNRDAMMGMLAKADPMARVEIQALTSRLLSTRNDDLQTRARVP
jgi:hypothetical protein